MDHGLRLQLLHETLTRAGVTQQEILGGLRKFGKQRILLLGDLIIDVYTQCTAIGKTAKTPTLSVKRGISEYYWGGSSLICKNLLAMGGTVTFVAVTGDDWGYEFFAKEHPERLTSQFFKDKTRPTTIKERFWVDGYKLLQIDTVENHEIPEGLENEIFAYLESAIDTHDAVFIADNRHGTMSHGLIQRAKALSHARRIPTYVDTQVSSRWGNLEEYANVTLICVNENEARFFLRDERAPITDVLQKLVAVLKPQQLIIKLKDKGMIGWDAAQGMFSFPAIPVQSVDPIGAGDAFLSAAVLSLTQAIRMEVSMFLASCAGAISVTKMGTAPISSEEIETFAKDVMHQMELS